MTISPSDFVTRVMWVALLTFAWLSVRSILRGNLPRWLDQLDRWLRERRCPSCGVIHDGEVPTCPRCHGWPAP